MAGFKKAKAEQAALKMGLYGPPGKGKTLSALLIAEGLAKISGKRVAYVDTERGTDFYCKAVPERKVHPEAFDFDAIYTRSLTDIIRDVKSLRAEDYGVVIIDSITHVWEAARAAYSGRETSAGSIPFHAWAKIKKPYKELIAHLLSCPMHVIICGRQGNEFDTDEGGETKKVGVKMKAEGETAYEPHILIRMEEVRGDAGSAILAVVEKDRTGIIAGKTIQLWPSKNLTQTFDSLVKPMLPLLGGTQAKIETEEETGTKDAEQLAAEEQARIKRSEELLEGFKRDIYATRTADDLKALGKRITPEIKKQMMPADVAELRNIYTAEEQRMTGKAPARNFTEADIPH
ncbi:MAG TPA: AAA family ATPase [Tepidisphaeraceae bacterium]|nr:AAA family ATPase [Tepidisphaeraceae bacterium]